MAAPGDVSHSDPTLQPWRQLLAPLAALAVLAVVGTIVSRGFLSVTWQDGHLSGPLIDVLNRAAPLMLVSLGMMTVIGTLLSDLLLVWIDPRIRFGRRPA